MSVVLNSNGIAEICRCTARNRGVTLPVDFIERAEKEIARRIPRNEYVALSRDGLTAEVISGRLVVEILAKQFEVLEAQDA